MALRISDMPEPLLGRALYAHAQYFHGDIGTIRVISFIAISILCAPVGFLYHSALALKNRVIAFISPETDFFKALAYEHFKAALMDLQGLFTFFLGPDYFDPKSYFSSTPVSTGLQFKIFSGNIWAQNGYQVSVIKNWGATAPATVQKCPYNLLKEEVFRRWRVSKQNLALGSNEVVFPVCKSVFFGPRSTSDPWARDPAFFIESLPFTPGVESPNYPSLYKVIGIALLILPIVGLLIYFVSNVVPIVTTIESAFTLNHQIFLKTPSFEHLAPLLLNFGQWFGICIGLFGLGLVTVLLSMWLIDKAITLYEKEREGLEKPFADSLISLPTTNNSQSDTRLVEQALYWYRYAAQKGDEESKFFLGTCILASFANCDTVDELSLEELRIARNGVCYLQSICFGQLSGNVDTILLPLNWDQIDKGCFADNEEERHRQFLAAFPKDLFSRAKVSLQTQVSKEKSDLIHGAIAASRRATIVREVEKISWANEEKFPEALATLIAQYKV